MPRAALAVGLVLSIGGWILCGCKDSKPQSSPQVEHPRTAGPPTASPPKANRQADNAACLDCHMDFADELISAKHLDKGFACTACHGESIAHGEDEGNVTKPELGSPDILDSFPAELQEAVRSIENNTPSALLDGALARDALVLAHKQTQSIIERKTVAIDD